MLGRFLNTRVPSILLMIAFVACCIMFCVSLAGARDVAELTPPVTRRLIAWGILSLFAMLAFCLCLARVTRYRRGLPDKRGNRFAHP
jgi:type VI protein secretion system component VasK